MSSGFAVTIRLTLAISVIFGVMANAAAATSQSSSRPKDQRELVLARTEAILGNYFFDNKAQALRNAIEAHKAELLSIDDQKKFAAALTAVLQAASQDKHIIVWFSSTADENQGRKPSPPEVAVNQRFFQYVAYGYDASARLPGNIGYLRLGGFADMPAAKATIDSAMMLVSQTNALIIDLRGNGGGDSDTTCSVIFLLSQPK